MTIREQGFLIWEYYRSRLNAIERKMLSNMLEGIKGLHDEENPLTDEKIKEILSDKQVSFIERLGRRFRLRSRKKWKT